MTDADYQWHSSSADLVLLPDELHIWRLALEQPSAQIAALARLLSPDEQNRAARFHFEHDRRRFIISHAGLRQILGRYLNRAPECLPFSLGPHGKPYLADDLADSGIQFNLSHSHELAMLAVTRHCAIGIDVEYVRPLSDMLALAARCFSAEENAALLSLPDDQQVSAFFRGWTCKEAWLKATGHGLSEGLSQIQVSVQPTEPVRLLAVEDSPALAAHWSLISLEPAPSYIATAAIAHPRVNLSTLLILPISWSGS